MIRTATGVWAVLPVKGFAHAKSRLASVLDSDARGSLARQLFEHTRRALADTAGVDVTLIATDSAEVMALASDLGLEAIVDGAQDGLGPVLDRALAHAARRGARVALITMGDLPHFGADDASAMLGALDECDVALAPDRARQGTNALALRLPAPSATCFGHVDSYARHLAWCAAHGLSVTTVVRDGLAFDIDDPRDLTELS